jgi:hypothetical protein
MSMSGSESLRIVQLANAAALAAGATAVYGPADCTPYRMGAFLVVCDQDHDDRVLGWFQDNNGNPNLPNGAYLFGPDNGEINEAGETGSGSTGRCYQFWSSMLTRCAVSVRNNGASPANVSVWVALWL